MNDQYQTSTPDDLAALAMLWPRTPDVCLDKAADLLRADIQAEAADPPRLRPAPRGQRHRVSQRRWLVAGSGIVAAAIVMAALVAPRLLSGSGPGQAGGTTYPGGPPVSVGTAHSEAELVAFAVRSAAISPSPQMVDSRSWFYARIDVAGSSGGSGGFLFGTPDKRVIYAEWTRADGTETAGMSHGKVIVRSMGDGIHSAAGTAGWPSVSWRYLSSLPSDPRRLEQIIAANSVQRGQTPAQRNYAVFEAVVNLMTDDRAPVLPNRLYASLYGVLQIIPGVRYDQTTDLAGRHGVGFYMRSDGNGAEQSDGWLKEEIVVNPSTYQYLGYQAVAAQAHTFTGQDGSRDVAAGHVLGWMALVDSGIVARPGELPS